MSSNEYISTISSPHLCSNCGTSGHTYRQCVEPVSSYGVLVFRWLGKTDAWSPMKEFCRESRSPTGLIHTEPQVLMIQRKDSLGFMDLMRGKYKLNEPEYIRKQIRGTTLKERTSLLNDDFDVIWHNLWGSDAELSNRYAQDRQISKQKLTEIRKGVELHTGEKYTLSDLLRQEPLLYETPEWGFPKGRREPYETDIQCAYRELHEETGIKEEELWKVVNVAPFIETFYGSNDIHYRHTYYLAQYIGSRNVTFDVLNSEMIKEIGTLEWKSMDDALLLLRPDNLEKRGILIQLATLFRNLVPIFKEPVIGERINSLNENTLREQQDLYVYRSKFSRNGGVLGKMERPRRFFGERHATRRISEIRESTEGSHSDIHTRQSRGRGRIVSIHRRQPISYETSEEARVQGESTKEDHGQNS